MFTRRLVMLALLAPSLGCEGPRRVYLEISSEIAIESESNRLLISANDEQRSHVLGKAPLDSWPLLLPIESTKGVATEFKLELRLETEGRPSKLVGFAVVPVDFTGVDEREVPVRIPRSCRDEDNDGYGVGFGCDRVDCNDGNRYVPAQAACEMVMPDNPNMGMEMMTPEMPAGRLQCNSPAVECPAGTVCDLDYFGFFCLDLCVEDGNCTGGDGWYCDEVDFGVSACFCGAPCINDFGCVLYGGGRCINGCCSTN